MEDSKELSEDIILAKDFVQGILKAKKLLKMYPPNNPIYTKTSEEIYNKLQSFFELNSELSLKISQHEIMYSDTQIYHNPQKEDNLALFLFKDGIREVSFLNGLSRKDFEVFIKILNTDFENSVIDDDIVTLLWEQDFEYIKYDVDEETLFDEDADEHEKACQKAKDNLYSDDDLEKAYQDGLKISEKQASTLIPVDESELKLIIKEIEKEETHLKIDKVISILSELLYQTTDRSLFTEIVGFMEDVVLYCIKEGNFKRASFILNTINTDIKNKNIDSENIKIIQKLFTTINSKPFIQEIGNIIDDEESAANDEELMNFVKYLDKTSIPLFIEMLGELQNIKSRRLVIEILSITGRLDMETIANGLYDNKWYVVRNIILILGKIADTKAIEYLTKTLSHTDQRVRKEAVKAMGSIGGTAILPHLKSTLEDSDPSVRITVAKVLGSTKSEGAKHILLNEMSQKSFPSKDFIEKKEFFEAITSWKDQGVKNFLLATLKKKKFWGKTKNDETRACAAYAIGIIGNKDAISYLKTAQNTKNKLLKTFSANAIKQLTN